VRLRRRHATARRPPYKPASDTQQNQGETAVSPTSKELGVLAPAVSVAIVEQDHLERNCSSVGHDSSSSESYSGKISAKSSRSGAGGGARGTILSDLRTEGGVVPGAGGGSAWRRHGKVGSSWGCGPVSAGRGLLIRPLLPEPREGGVKKSGAGAGERAW
jgi:hypothetical protein